MPTIFSVFDGIIEALKEILTNLKSEYSGNGHDQIMYICVAEERINVS